MRKKHVVSMNDVIGVRTERSVLMRIRHPFIIRLVWAFHSDAKLYPPPPPASFCLRHEHNLELIF